MTQTSPSHEEETQQVENGLQLNVYWNLPCQHKVMSNMA
jgi:hypothetical protein